MKKIIFALSLLIAVTIPAISHAQIHITIRANIGSQPLWGPVGYDRADYYYMPEIETYYSVSRHQYVYMQGGRWIFSASLPYQYRNYDLYRGYKVVINDDPSPYRHHETYKTKYTGYRNDHSQPVIRNSHETKYYEIKGHPDHNKWKPANRSKGNRGRH